MPIELTQSANPDRFTARHWMFVPIERVTEPPNPPTVPYRGLVSLSGVALVNVQGDASGQWHRDRVILHLGEDFDRAMALSPYQPSPGNFLEFVVEQWVVFATVNARYNANVANNDGSAVDWFGLDTSQFATVLADIAVRDSDGWLYRVGYDVQFYGHLNELPSIK